MRRDNAWCLRFIIPRMRASSCDKRSDLHPDEDKHKALSLRTGRVWMKVRTLVIGRGTSTRHCPYARDASSSCDQRSDLHPDEDKHKALSLRTGRGTSTRHCPYVRDASYAPSHFPPFAKCWGAPYTFTMRGSDLPTIGRSGVARVYGRGHEHQPGVR